MIFSKKYSSAKSKFICFMLLFLCSLTLVAAEFAFAENGKAQCVIAMPDKPVGFEKDAVDDLSSFLGRMTGAKFQVFPESKLPANKSVIYVGQTEFAKKQKIDFNKLNPEEWIIRTVGKNLILSGGKPIGSVYAVWQLLNKFGCYTLTWDQDAVPTYKVLKKDIANEQKKPSFSGRMIYSRTPSILRHSGAPKHILNKFVNWKHRNGINGRHNPVDNQWTYSAHYISHYPSAHSLSLYVNPELFKKHPEYFTMNEAGKRMPPRRFAYGGSLCMSNPKVAEITLDSLRKMIKKDRAKLPKDRWPTVYDISTLDGMVYICKCPECKAIIKDEGARSGLLLRYINSVAKEIKKEYPELYIRTFCYGYSTGTPPKKIRPESNVLIQLCDKFSLSDPFHPLSHPMNVKRKEYFEEWRKIAKRIMIWDYWTVGRNPHPCTVINAMPEDLKYFHSLNVTDIFLEASRNTYSPQSFIDLSYFVAAQMMLNVDQDPEKLIDIYLKYYFGPAEAQMRQLFQDIREGVSRQKNVQGSRALSHWDYLTPHFMCSRYVELKKLAESFPKGNIYRKRINAERMPFIWYVISKRESYREAFMNYAKINVDDLVEEWRTLVDEYLRRYPCTKPYNRSNFDAAYNKVAIKYPRPEKFKSVPDKDIRITGWTNFSGRITNYSSVIKDPDSITGKALIANHPDPIYHGVNKPVPDSKVYKTTTFSWKNIKYPRTAVRMTIKKVPQDEKYHWYKFPGKLVFKNNSSVFYLQTGQAINVDTTHLFDFINTDEKSNTWTAWFSAKFTGPEYVKGSKKPNAVYVDMLVLTREDAKKKMKLVTLGTGAGNPSMTRDNSSSYLDTRNGVYVIDAGAPVGAKLLRKGVDFNTIRAVFITHQHEDHFGGLPSILKNRMRGNAKDSPKWRGFWPEVWLPTQQAVDAFDKLMEIQFYGNYKDQVIYKVIKPGLFYDDGYLKVTAIQNKHWPIKTGGYRPSYCFLVEFEGKKVLFTGDLSSDCSDFPVEAAKNADIVVCELTHIHPEVGMKYFKQIKPGKLVFNHVAERYERMFPEFSKELKYPAAVAKDGDEFEF